CELRHDSTSLQSRCVHSAACEENIAHERVTGVALEPWNSTESWNEPEAELRKGEPCHLVGDDDVAHQRQFESASKANAVNRSDGNEGRCIDRVTDSVNALQEFARTSASLLRRSTDSSLIELAQIPAG